MSAYLVLAIGSRFRSTLPPHTPSPACRYASLRLLWPTYGRTFTAKIAPMLGAQRIRSSLRTTYPYSLARTFTRSASTFGGHEPYAPW